MKKRIALIFAGAVLLTGCRTTESQNTSVPFAEREENTALSETETKASDITLPDLSGAGIDTSVFTKSEEKYDEEIEWRWFYDGERPHFRFDLYTSPDGAQLAYDEKGRIVRFRNTPDIINADFIESDDVPLDKIQNFVDDTVPEGISITFEGCGGYTEYCPTNTKYYNLIEKAGENGWVNAKINGDGTIQSVDFEYYVPESEVDSPAYEKEAEELIKQFSADGEGSIIRKQYICADGEIYGLFDILTGFVYEGNEEPLYGEYNILIRPEHDTIPFMSK